MPNSLSICVVGCGAVVEELHGPTLLALQRQGAIRVVAAVDTDQARRNKFCKRFPTAQAFSDLAAALSAQPVQLTLVASPPVLHRNHVEMAMLGGSHVLCEKPLTTTVEDAAALSQLSRETGKVLAVGLTRRFYPSLACAARILRSGELGSSIRFTYREGDPYGWPVASDAPFRRRLAGGGVLTDKGVHILDSMLWLFGRMQVEGAWDDALGAGVEGNVLVHLVGGKAQGTVQISWDQGCENGLWIQGELGELRIQPGEFRFLEHRVRGGDWTRRPTECTWTSDVTQQEGGRCFPADYDDCIRLQWAAVIRAIRFAEPYPVDAASAEFVIAQIAEIYARVQSLKSPWLPGRQQDQEAARHWRSTSSI